MGSIHSIIIIKKDDKFLNYYDEEEILSKKIVRMETIGFKPDKSYFLHRHL